MFYFISFPGNHTLTINFNNKQVLWKVSLSQHQHFRKSLFLTPQMIGHLKKITSTLRTKHRWLCSQKCSVSFHPPTVVQYHCRARSFLMSTSSLYPTPACKPCSYTPWVISWLCLVPGSSSSSLLSPFSATGSFPQTHNYKKRLEAINLHMLADMVLECLWSDRKTRDWLAVGTATSVQQAC